ncbi:hypothetical protein NLO95_18240 [Pseudomonas syringae]|nr:hypothetical protein [Pseudomonas syringae]
MSGKQSKRKRKNQAEQSKPRLDAVYGNTSGDVSFLTITFDENGRLTIPELDPGSIQRRITYEREGKREKVVYAAPAEDFTQDKSQWGEVVRRFDYLMAVDTNTLKELPNGIRVSVCTVFGFSNAIALLGKNDHSKHLESYLICDTNTDFAISHEPIGWHLAVTRSAMSFIQGGKRVGLITDHDLGGIADYNSGRSPYFSDFVLPDTIALLYASSDKTDNFANILIRECDRGATKILEKVKDRTICSFLHEGELIELGSALCFRVRVEPTPKATPR